MVYIKGDGALESQKVVIIILGDRNQEIVELTIYSTSIGEFSTIWIVGSDLGDGTYTIKASDPSSQAETTITITGTAFVTKKVVSDISGNAETLAAAGGEVVVDDTTGDTQVGTGFLYDKQFNERISLLEQLVSAIQGLLASLTTSVQGLQTQLSGETTARQGADELLQGQIDVLGSKTPILTVAEKSVIITILSGQQSSNTITCPAGDIAQGGGIEKLTTLASYIEIFANNMVGTDSWFFQASNTHPTDSLDVKLFINCFNIDYSPTIVLSSNTNP